MSATFVSARQRATNAALAQLGQSVAQRRLLSRLTQGSLAEKAGVSRRTVARIEAGDPGTRLDNLIAVAGALGVREELARAIDPVFDPTTSAAGLASIPQRGRL